MIRTSHTSISVSRIAISLLFLLSFSNMRAQGFLKLERDSVPMFQGFAVSFDVVGAAMMQLGDYGQYEGALRLNLHNQYFPTIEIGYGKASHNGEEDISINYHTKAPYFRVGCDVNIMKRKHTGNRIFAGLRYAYTNYKVDIDRPNFNDPVWKWDTSYGVKDEKCYQHWAEVLFGIDAKVAGPLHLGWSIRYRQRLAHNDGQMGKTWYVPGYGTQNNSKLGATFNITIDI